MKRKNIFLIIIFIIIIFIILILPANVLAHPGRTDKYGCHTCYTNCSSWGLSYGQYHCHNGGSSSTTKKSSVKTLSSLYVDGEKVTISNNMSIKTNNPSPNIKAYTTSSVATVKTNQKSKLSYGNNKITITVTAENKSTKKYYLNVYLNNDDTSLKSLKIDDQNVSIGEKMTFKTLNKNPSIVAKATNSKAKVTIEKNSNFNVGDNEVKIIVTAENGSTKEYLLNLHIISTDATLRNLKVNKDSIDIVDSMNYITTKSDISITPIANDENATIIYDKNNNLEIGANEIKIKVIAEDRKTTKEYILNVTRELILSDNTNIKVLVNNEEVKFNKYKSDIVYINHDIDEIDIKYELEDEKATIELDYDKKIEVGDKTIKFKVISESGKEQKYEINIHRNSKAKDVISTIIAFSISGCIGGGIIGGIGFVVYKIKG